jgi:hypothetical protein
VADNEHAVVMKLRNHDALVETTQGRGQACNKVLIAAMNMAEALACCQPQGAWRPLDGGHPRWRRTHCSIWAAAAFDRGSFLFTGQELQAINVRDGDTRSAAGDLYRA